MNFYSISFIWQVLSEFLYATHIERFSTVTCQTHIPMEGELYDEGLDAKLPRGWYRIGPQQIRHDSSWLNLYRRRATGSGYWDFYTNIPERNCIG